MYDLRLRLSQIQTATSGTAAFCILAIWVVLRWTAKIDVEEYSNPEDFPVNFARRQIWTMVAVMVLLWVNALLDSPAAMAVLNVLLSISSTLLLIAALHPHRHGEPDEEAAPERPAPISPMSSGRNSTVFSLA